ncbi:ABC transporter permease [Pseudotenacibaculum haliotis]|uniref:ABC transporter permease n=1 Tax=Pseudotenacibaculum haliotis TaxID=1862138 RepID=A0ABW5LTM9_9FLAO
MSFPLYIAKRYLFAKSGNNAINIITMIASLGVIVGTAALFVILSGFSGLRTFSNSLLDISDPDIKISVVKGKSFFYTDSLKTILDSNSDIVDFSRVIEERVFLRSQDKQQIAYVKGVDYNYVSVVKLDSAIQVGNWLEPQYKNTSVLGNGLAFKLSLGVMNFGEPLEIVVPKTGTGLLNPNSTRSIKTQIVGVYVGTEEFENKYVFVSNLQAQHLLNYAENQFTAIEIKLQPDVNPDAFANALQKQVGSQFKVQTKAQLNELFYKVINTENFVSYLIFTLIMVIAMFNVVGAIIMMIIDKKKNLKTILNLGATLKEIKRIFVLQGFLLTVVGMLIGLFLAVILVFVQQQFEFFMITSTIAYPVELKLTNLLVVVGTISVLGFLAAKIASSRISIRFLES